MSAPPRVYLRSQLGRRVCDEQLRSGAWTRVRPGAYVETPTGKPWEVRRHLSLGRCVAASQQLTDAVLARTSAAAVHGLAVWELPETPQLIQPHGRSSHSAPDVVRSVAALDEEDVIVVHGCRATALLRTMLDCARYEHPRDALVVVDSGLRSIVRPRRRDSRADVESRAQPVREELLARIAPRSRGAAQARAVVRASDPLAESAPESVMRWIALSRGMPRPVLQQSVVTARGTSYTDMAWRRSGSRPARWIHIEFDGTIKYSSDRDQRPVNEVVLAERQREAAITDTGDWVTRVYSDEIRDEDKVFRKLTSHITPSTVASWRPDPHLFRLPGT